MLERLRELWAERPALVAAAGIAPVAFVVTLLVLFLAAGGNDPSQPEQQAAAQQDAQNDQSAEQADQQQVASQPEVTVIVRGAHSTDAQSEQAQSQEGESPQQSQQVDDQQQSDALQEQQQVVAQQQEESQEPTVPSMVAGFEVIPLRSLLPDGINEDTLKHGSDGSEGAILPRANGVVRSSGARHQTSWELIIPSAGLKSAVVSLGRTPTGAMGSPDNPYVVGWLDSTAAPGEVGNTLLAGHRDYEDISGNIGTGVCWELNNTRVGDHMLIWDEELNVYYVYTVTETVTLDPTDRDSARYLHNTDEPVVTLITCTGSFNTETSRYSHRLVVVGELAAVASPDA